MAKNMNKKTSKKKRKAPGKVSVFFEKHKKVIFLTTVIILAVALIASVAVFAFKAATANIPYFIRFNKYIEVPQYMGVTIKNEDVKKEFDKSIKALLLKDAAYEVLTEGKIEEGYKVIIDAKGYVIKADGTREEKPFNSGTLNDYTITDIGNHYTESGVAFSEEIQKAIIGNEIKDIGTVKATVEYPDTYSVDEVRGKKAEFDITVKKVEKTILPEYTDTYVHVKTGYKNIAEYEEYLEKEIRTNLVWNKIVNDTNVKKFYTPKVEEYIAEFVEPYNNYMEQNKKTFTEMLKELNISEETYFKNRDSYAYGLVREEMILYYIVRKEDIELSKEEYKVIGNEIALENGYTSLQDLEDSIGEDNAYRSILWEKLKKILVENANFV